MNEKAKRIVSDLQAVLDRHGAALFFGPDNEAELWANGLCVGHVTHSDNCELVEGTICETEQQTGG